MERHAGWPCAGPLLDLAERFARKLLPAFNTETGMPFGTVCDKLFLRFTAKFRSIYVTESTNMRRRSLAQRE
jgi:hypothetical protein